MGVGGKGYGGWVGRGTGCGGGGHVVRLGGLGGGDLLQGGVLEGQKGPRGELVGSWLSLDVTGHVVPIESGRCPHGLLIRWQLLRRGRGGWSGAPGFLFGFPSVGW